MTKFSTTCLCNTVLGMRRKYKFSEAPDLVCGTPTLENAKSNFISVGSLGA